jgi:hypothetical protein
MYRLLAESVSQHQDNYDKINDTVLVYYNSLAMDCIATFIGRHLTQEQELRRLFQLVPAIDLLSWYTIPYVVI